MKEKTSAEWTEALNAAGVPCGPVNTIDQVFADPQVQHLGLAGEVESPFFGTLKVVRSPVQLSRTPASLRRSAPVPGEQSREILEEMGFAAEEIDSLTERGVVSIPKVITDPAEVGAGRRRRSAAGES
jgi:crotonobetainyl-CoA:carnitine CoA-transferase CaiB-like acyl-CoA transferase